MDIELMQYALFFFDRLFYACPADSSGGRK